MQFSYNDRTHRLENRDASITAENHGSREEFYRYILKWDGKVIVFEATKTQMSVESVKYISWTVGNISSNTPDHRPYRYGSRLEMAQAIDVIKNVLRCTDGWSNKRPFKVVSVELGELPTRMLNQSSLS